MDDANRALVAAGSIVRLATQSRSITVGGQRLLRVQPVLAQQQGAAPNEEFVSLVRSTCISLACRLMGSTADKKAHARLRGGADGFGITPYSDSDPKARSLAGKIATVPDGGLDMAGAVGAAEDRDQAVGDYGRAYGQAINGGGRAATAAHLGINEDAPQVGEGFAIFSMLAQQPRGPSAHRPRPPHAGGSGRRSIRVLTGARWSTVKVSARA